MRAGEHGTSSCYLHNGCRCDTCVSAWNAYQAEWRRTPKGREYQRRNGRIQARAKAELVRRHREEFAAILAEVRAAEVEG